MDAAKFNEIVGQFRGLNERDLGSLLGVIRGLIAVKQTERKRREIVARNRAQQGIAIPRQRGPRSESRDQSSAPIERGSAPQ